jgi:hypothetical protein
MIKIQFVPHSKHTTSRSTQPPNYWRAGKQSLFPLPTKHAAWTQWVDTVQSADCLDRRSMSRGGTGCTTRCQLPTVGRTAVPSGRRRVPNVVASHLDNIFSRTGVCGTLRWFMPLRCVHWHSTPTACLSGTTYVCVEDTNAATCFDYSISHHQDVYEKVKR